VKNGCPLRYSAIVLSGRLTLTVEGETHLVGPADPVLFAGGREHWYANEGGGSGWRWPSRRRRWGAELRGPEHDDAVRWDAGPGLGAGQRPERAPPSGEHQPTGSDW
jgi:hypothetical protein